MIVVGKARGSDRGVGGSAAHANIFSSFRQRNRSWLFLQTDGYCAALSHASVLQFEAAYSDPTMDPQP